MNTARELSESNVGSVRLHLGRSSHTRVISVSWVRWTPSTIKGVASSSLTVDDDCNERGRVASNGFLSG